MESKIQSVLFDKNKITLNHAIDWLDKNGYSHRKVDETQTLFRFRQISPKALKVLGYDKYAHKRLNNFVSLLIAYKH
jgi:hypothetical protein